MKKTGIFALALALFCMTSSDVFARHGHHHGRYGGSRTYTSVGFMFDMTPRHSWYGPSVVAVPVAIESTRYIQRSADDSPTQQYWYYCTAPQGYYPWVRECQGSWVRVIPFPVEAQ
jgi:hypothetical protein